MTKKYDKNTALAKIKVLIKRFYELVGREEIEADVERSELIDDIEEILDNTDVPIKNIILESLELDKETKERLKFTSQK